jgi:5-methylcytosine-specific restriction protein A
MRYPNVSDTPDKIDSFGNLLCRNCDNLVSSTRKHYCSQHCMEEFNRNNSWFWVRKDVLRRDKWTCAICDGRFVKRKLDVDHIIPVRLGGNPFDKKNLRTLCKNCHKAKTKLDKDGFGR